MEKVLIDVPMPVNYIRKDLIQEMKLLEPFGKGNEKPLFAQKGLRVMDVRVFGKNRNVVKVKLADEMGYGMDGIYFGDGDQFLEDIRGKENTVDRLLSRNQQLPGQRDLAGGDPPL